jgi:hypothetical protein
MNQEIDFYSVLGLDPSAEKSILKKRYSEGVCRGDGGGDGWTDGRCFPKMGR